MVDTSFLVNVSNKISKANMAKSKRDGAAGPTNTDDISEGYTYGSLWIDRTNNNVYINTNDTEDNAVWKDVGTTINVTTHATDEGSNDASQGDIHIITDPNPPEIKINTSTGNPVWTQLALQQNVGSGVTITSSGIAPVGNGALGDIHINTGTNSAYVNVDGVGAWVRPSIARQNNAPPTFVTGNYGDIYTHTDDNISYINIDDNIEWRQIVTVDKGNTDPIHTESDGSIYINNVNGSIHINAASELDPPPGVYWKEIPQTLNGNGEPVAPANYGDIYIDTAGGVPYINTGDNATSWKYINTLETSTDVNPPNIPLVTGSMWYNTGDRKLNIYNNGNWDTVQFTQP